MLLKDIVELNKLNDLLESYLWKRNLSYLISLSTRDKELERNKNEAKLDN